MCFLRIDKDILYILYMLFKTKDSGHQCPMVRIFLVVFLDISILRGIFGCEKEFVYKVFFLLFLSKNDSVMRRKAFAKLTNERIVLIS